MRQIFGVLLAVQSADGQHLAALPLDTCDKRATGEGAITELEQLV